MGNAEARAMTQSSPLIQDELRRAHQNFLTFKKQYALDRSGFSLLFDSTVVPYQMIDQLFESYDISKTGSIAFEELALGVIASSNLDIGEKLDIMFDSIDLKGTNELTKEQVRTAIGRFLKSAVGRLRGSSAEGAPFGGDEEVAGSTKYYDRRCSGCKQVPLNLSYECLDCRQGYALGVPITVHLCKECVAQWEGYGVNSHDMKHTLGHRICKSVFAPNPHQVTHCGVECTGCGLLPIVGTRYRCKDCLDWVNLCTACFESGEVPRGHLLQHNLEKLSKAPSLEEEVMHFVDGLFQLAPNSGGCGVDGRVSRKIFIEWGLGSEVAMALLRGLEVQHVQLSMNEESCVVEETTSND